MLAPSVADRLKRRAGGLLVLLGAAAVASVVRAAVPPQSPSSSANDPIIARVEGKPIRLSEVQELKRRNQERYEKETGKAAPGAFDTFFMRIGLEEAVRQRLVELDARAKGLTVSDAQAESAMKLDPFFRQGSTFDAARFAAYRTQNPKSFAEAREQARSALLYQRRMRGLEKELVPAAQELAQLARVRDQKARVRYLLVSDLHYDGAHDPTDDELRAFYETEKSDLARPAELSYTAATIARPSGAPEQKGALVRATELLASARAGAPFDSLLRVDGVVSSSGVWRPGANTGLFVKNEGLARDALALPAGSFVPSVVESPDGFAIVRVDRTQQASVPTLAQVAVDLRARWRAKKIEAEETGLARAYYDAHPDSFTTAAWTVRWARIDSSQVVAREPKDADLRSWFEAHRGEFARLDPSGGGIQTRGFEEVKDQVARRWRQEDRALEARRLADELATSWAKGKDGKSSRAVKLAGPTTIVESGMLPPDLPRALADSARAWTAAPRALVVLDGDGFGVVGLVRYEPKTRVSFDVIEPRVRDLAYNQRTDAERASARDWYENHLDHFMTGPGYKIVHGLAVPPPTVGIDIPGEKIERYYQEHRSDFGSPPEVHVRHILIMTDKRSDADAKALATRLLVRLRGGENFANLARTVSEDPGSRDEGGDLGFVKRGTTVPAFERAAFALTPEHPLSNLVRTQFGYHILQLLERRDGKVPPFSEVRVQIGQKLAEQYADTLARMSAQNLLRDAKNSNDLLTLADQRKLASQYTSWYDGQALLGPALLDEVRADAPNVRQGAIFPRIYKYLNQGYIAVALDSILPAHQLTFDEVRDRALLEKQRERGLAAAQARADRLEKDLASGIPWERAIETVGGETETRPLARGVGLPTLGPVAGLDSLLFGPGPDTLSVMDWKRLKTPRGDLFVQLLERTSDSGATAANQKALRDTVLNRRMYDYIERLRSQYAVKVLRADLAERLPPPPEI
jgi:parvulin-like peptidyl-prolyl isomerase